MDPKYLILGLVQRMLPLKMRGWAERASVPLSVAMDLTNGLWPGCSAGHRMPPLLLLLPALLWVLSDALGQDFGLTSLPCPEVPAARPTTVGASGC